MYRRNRIPETDFNIDQSVEGESIEAKVRRIMLNNEPITDGAPTVYTERSDGILEATDVRTDRFEIAINAHDRISSEKIAKREERLKALKGGVDSADSQNSQQSTSEG